jgi:hypothetical protein
MILKFLFDNIDDYTYYKFYDNCTGREIFCGKPDLENAMILYNYPHSPPLVIDFTFNKLYHLVGACVFESIELSSDQVEFLTLKIKI